VVLHKIGEASVDIGELAEFGEDFLGEVVEELADLRSVNHGNGEWIEPVSRYKVSKVWPWWPPATRLRVAGLARGGDAAGRQGQRRVARSRRGR